MVEPQLREGLREQSRERLRHGQANPCALRFDGRARCGHRALHSTSGRIRCPSGVNVRPSGPRSTSGAPSARSSADRRRPMVVCSTPIARAAPASVFVCAARRKKRRSSQLKSSTAATADSTSRDTGRWMFAGLAARAQRGASARTRSCPGASSTELARRFPGECRDFAGTGRLVRKWALGQSRRAPSAGDS